MIATLPIEPTTTRPAWQEKLATRGILQAALDAGWGYYDYQGAPGWSYPLRKGSGGFWDGVQRWKALDSAYEKKYMWLYAAPVTKKPEGCDFYWTEGAIAAIAQQNGVLRITAGEPDLLTLRTVGMVNVTSFFGESNIPHNLIDVLNVLKVSTVLYYADNDKTGLEAARKLTGILAGTSIACETRLLSEHYKDLNEIWKTIDFDSAMFLAMLTDAPLLKLDPPKPPSKIITLPQTDEGIDGILRALEAQGYKYNADKSYLNGKCIFHDDQHASFGVSVETGVGNCFTCGTKSPVETAERLGVPYHKRAPAALATKAELANAPASVPQSGDDITVSRGQAAEEFINSLTARDPNPAPIFEFPFRCLHQFGGMCEIVEAGQMVMVMGLSGAGKTSLIEPMMETMMRNQLNVMVAGGEWTPAQAVGRSVQRAGGITRQMQKQIRLRQYQIAQGIDHPAGIDLTADVLHHAEFLLRQQLDWNERQYFIKGSHWNLIELADRMYADILKLKTPIHAVWVDYAQMYAQNNQKLPPPAQVQYFKNKLSPSKDFPGVGMFIVTQVTKLSAKTKRQQKQSVDASDANNINEYPFNLVIAAEPCYLYDANDDIIGNDDKGTIRVLKNNEGQSYRKITARMDLQRLRWIDEEVSEL